MSESAPVLRPLPKYLLGWLVLPLFLAVCTFIATKEFFIEVWDLTSSAFKGEII